ncbi:MAG: N-acetylneuraminate synthase family protein [Patescibacteria group bacterium]|nr:N-acetylneuraminate synthase family protein [Patescibacteria group bacterium]
MNIVKIRNKSVGPGQPTYIVAEIGINHNGYLRIAKDLIDVAVKAGADAVKFQTRNVDVVFTEEELTRLRPVPKNILENAITRGVLPDEAIERLQSSDFRQSTNGDLKRLLEFSDEEYAEISRYCEWKGIDWFTSCWDADSIDRMEKFNPPCHKIASACNEDDELMLRARATEKPIILSTGMTDLEGVKTAIEIIGKENLVILHCTSVYPKGAESNLDILKLINLRGMDTLSEEFGVPVGFSSHDSGIQPTYASVVRGAVMVEKHITLERGMWGSDQGSSVESSSFIHLCGMIRQIPSVLGDGEIVVYPAEEEVSNKLRRVRRKK